MDENSFSVSEAIALINQTLDYAYPVLVVEGEVASYKINQGKFVFFDIKDDDGTLGCFMMLFQQRMPLEDGMKVQVVASPKLTGWGKFSLTVREVRLVGEGSMKRSFEILRAKLESEGLFAPERKRALPSMPKRVAVISSTQAAGYADFMRIINERWGGMMVEVAHVQVQGAEAPDQIIRALKHFNEQEVLPEVIVLIRGGGSADDLSAFNDELLVRAVASSRAPTLVGVGHETDESLVDLVADVRAATPSHAAQIIVPDKQEIIRHARVSAFRVVDRFEGALGEMIVAAKMQLEKASQITDDKLNRMFEKLASQRSVMAAYNPATVLGRGYALLRGDVSVGGSIELETARQIIKAEVKDVSQK